MPYIEPVVLYATNPLQNGSSQVKQLPTSFFSCAVSNLKKVSLELGGKSPLIIFSDCDMDKAVRMVREWDCLMVVLKQDSKGVAWASPRVKCVTICHSLMTGVCQLILQPLLPTLSQLWFSFFFLPGVDDGLGNPKIWLVVILKIWLRIFLWLHFPRHLDQMQDLWSSV